MLICRLFYTYFTFTYTHQWSFLSEYWYLPHSEVQFYSSMKFSQWLDIYLTVTWYWCHGDLIFMSQWLDIYVTVTVDIYLTVTIDIYLTVTWYLLHRDLIFMSRWLSFYVKSVIHPYMLHSLFLIMVLISDCWFGRRNFTTERRFDPGKNRS